MAQTKAFVILSHGVVDLAFRALDDAKTEIEAFEKDVSWYTASQKMMDRIEASMTALEQALK